MSEATARAVGSEGPTTITIAGRVCTTRPLKLKELGEIERECVKRWKRAYLETYAENVDLLPITDAERTQVIRAEMDKIAPWDAKNLPTRQVVDPAEMTATVKLAAWVRQNFRGNVPDDLPVDAPGAAERRERNEKTIRELAALAVDSELLSAELYRELTGEALITHRVGYVNWWITGSMDGMLQMIYAAFKHNGVTLDEVNAEVGSNEAMAAGLAREIEALTAPQLGN